MTTQATRRRLVQRLVVFALIPWIIVNLPLLAVLFEHVGGNETATLLMMYPGQFLFLAVVFLPAAVFAALSGAPLVKLWRDAGEKDELRRLWPTVFRPDWRLPAYAASIGILLAVLNVFGTGLEFYSLPQSTAASMVQRQDVVLDYISGFPTAERSDAAAENIRRAVKQAVGCGVVSGADPEPWFLTGSKGNTDQPSTELTAQLNSTVEDAIEVSRTSTNPASGVTPTNRQGHLRHIVVLDGLELGAVVFVAIHLFAWVVVLAILARRELKPDLCRQVRIAAMHAGMSLSLFVLWIPCRKYAVGERHLFDPCYQEIGGPLVVFGAILVSAMLVASVFVNERIVNRFMRIAASLVAPILAIASFIGDSSVLRTSIGGRANPFSIITILVVFAMAYLGLYYVFKIGLSTASDEKPKDNGG